MVPRRETTAWQPCLSNPDVLRICVESARKFFDRYPRAVGFSLGQNDNWGFCECPQCLEINEVGLYDFRGKRNYSPLYFSFLNRACEELQRTHPGRYLGGLIYISGTITPPPFKLHPYAVGYISNDRSRFHFDSLFRKREGEFLDSWMKKARTLALYEWHFGSLFLIPHLTLRSTRDFLRFAYSRGVRAYYAEEYPSWGLEGPKTYITAKLLWNVKTDIDELLDDYCEKMYGEAGAPMREYFDLLERVWNEQTPPVLPLSPYISQIRGSSSGSLLSRCWRSAGTTSMRRWLLRRASLCAKKFSSCETRSRSRSIILSGSISFTA